MKIIAIIQARLTSTRLPGKVLMKINGETIISRICKAIRASRVDKIVVVWAHKFPQFDENDVLSRYKYIVKRDKPNVVVRITSDCPLITKYDINDAIINFILSKANYYSNHYDGHDVQVFYPTVLEGSLAHKEHVIADFATKKTGLSVDTLEDLERVRKLC